MGHCIITAWMVYANIRVNLVLSAAELERVSSLGVLRGGVLSERWRRGAELLEAYGCDGVRHCRARRWRCIQWPWSLSAAVPLRCDVVCSRPTRRTTTLGQHHCIVGIASWCVQCGG